MWKIQKIEEEKRRHGRGRRGGQKGGGNGKVVKGQTEREDNWEEKMGGERGDTEGKNREEKTKGW